MIEKAKLIS